MSKKDDVQENEVMEQAEEKPKKKRGRPKKQKAEESLEKKASGENPELEALKSQVQLLTTALMASRREEPSKDEDSATIGVERVGGSELSMFLTDAYGREKHFVWRKVGDVLYMTPAQWEECQESEGAKRFFDRGWLKLEDEELSSVADPEKFITELDMEDIHDAIHGLEDITAVTRLLNHIEEKRIVTEDENGTPLKDEEGLPMAKVVKISPKHGLVAQVCVEAIYERTGMRYSLTDG